MTDETPLEVEGSIEQPRDDTGRFTETTPETVNSETETEPQVKEDADQGEDLHEERKRGRTAQDRINDLTRARREAERERDFYKGLVSQPTPASPVEGAPKPTPASFDTYDEYVEALTDWKVEQTISRQSSVKAQQTEVAVREANWASKLEEARQTLPDYAEVVGSSDVNIAPHVADALFDSDRGPELAYHMAQNPDYAERLNKLSPVKAAIELGRLEAALSTPVAKPTTKAPAPVSPIRSAPARQTDLSKVSMEEYVEMRRKQGAAF